MRTQPIADRTLVISDLDSVLCDTVPAALGLVFERYGVVVPPRTICRYDMEYAIADSLEAAGIHCALPSLQTELDSACWHNGAFFSALKPRTEIWAALHGWQRAGGALQFVTMRKAFLAEVTASWLRRHGFGLSEPGPLPGLPPLVLEAPKAAIARAGCGSYDRVVVLEDALHHVEAVAEASSAEVWVTEHAWNNAPLPARCLRLPDNQLAGRLAAL